MIPPITLMKFRRPAMGFILVTLFLDILGIGLIIPILPRLIEQLEGGDVSAASHTYGLLGALYALMQFLFAPILGSLSDRFGRRPVILGSLFGSGLDYLLLAYAPDLGWFYVGRLIAGITGANMTAATAYIADVSSPEKRAANFGMIGAAFGLGFIAGPALGGVLGDHDLRLPFFVAAGLTLLNWLYGLFVLPESLAVENRREFSWRRANPIGSFQSLKRHPLVFGLAVSFFLLSVGQFSTHSTWVLYTGYRYEWSPRQVGLSLAIVGLTVAIVQGGLSRRIIPALGEPRALVVGLCINVAAMIGYGLATEGWMVYCIVALGSIGAIGAPATQALITGGAEANEQGAVQGALTSLTSVAGFIAPMVSTGLFGYFISSRAPVRLPGAPFYLAALLILGALLVAVMTLRKHPPVGRGVQVESV